ncbi:chemotaxis protein CheA [Singulisphaera acidiphila]|uniref:Chemotaxis protein CheA n=1 Tax=Singulisphaera acidiphila (strain ATCC BAA-1392 / DSM 18658 / VKM B-2454 / MOB10) TaxID=886293 RepID=L0D5Q9_SINAD|nr:chemotaxis protein CheA [Singulisphaera acidiphila]AGA24754.1 chemotaxis protein histidine kinase-like protein [Singulisphaera acidiphila DSM 18658]
MSGFDLADLIPLYLDETDEQIVGLGDLLLQLERSPADEKALREAFRLVHCIKGASSVMGFVQVKGLTHHLETFFEQLRAGGRALDRPSLDLFFRCLDALRDYHAELRAKGESGVDFSGLTALVIERLGLPAEDSGGGPLPEAAAPAPAPAPDARPEPSLESEQVVSLTLLFESGLRWPDMKAKLVLNRLSAKARVISTDPSIEQLEEAESLPEFTIKLAAECGIEELHALADVDGVSEIRIETGPRPDPAGPMNFTPEPAPALAPAPEPTDPTPVEPAPALATTLASPLPPKGEPQAEVVTGEKRPKVTETVRVDVDRLDQLMNLAGELVISKARFIEISRGLEELFRGSNAQLLASDTSDRLDSIARGLEGFQAYGDGSTERWASQFRRLRENFRDIQDELDIIRQGRERLNAMAEAIHHLARVSDGIQRGVLETRMVPIGPLFDRFHRVIRDLRLSSDKEVVLKIEGEMTELDKRMVDELADPLIHMVRNSVDHGLEPPDQRERVGKPRAGTVSLAASHRGNSIVITVSDDGRGIDGERVRRKAVSNGLLDEDESRRLNDHQLIQFIWHPGLSTAETVTDISGRGVGMDIVKSRIENLNGTVDVRSEPGQGTTFSIRLPLTLAILPVLLTRINGETFAIPLDHLDEIVEVGSDEVYRIHGKPAIGLRGRVISLLTLDDAFRPGEAPPACEGAEKAAKKLTVAVISNGEATAGLVVDDLIGMQEAVLKSLEKNFQPIPGLSGASILGNGRVSLILDIDAMIEMATSGTAQPVG